MCLICNGSGTPQRIGNMAMMRCTACGFLWLGEKILSESHYGDLDIGATEQKVKRRKRNVLDRLKKIRRFISLDYTCDVGTGDGLFLKMLKNKGYAGCWGVEPSDSGARHSRALGLDVEQGCIRDIAALKKGRPVKVVTMYHVLEHLDDPRADIARLRDLLPSGGHLVIEVPNLRGFFAEKLGEDWEFYYPEHLWYFDDATLPAFIASCGFHIITMGRRDFDIAHKSIPELLFRLGICKHPHVKSTVTSMQPSQTEKQSTQPAQTSQLFAALHSIIRRILAIIVERTGRTDSLWIIAQKV